MIIRLQAGSTRAVSGGLRGLRGAPVLLLLALGAVACSNGELRGSGGDGAEDAEAGDTRSDPAELPDGGNGGDGGPADAAGTPDTPDGGDEVPPEPCANHCGNGRADCGEAGLDCGGECAACADPCTGHCGNGLFDCGEAGTDCGGECPACGTPCAAHCTNGLVDCGETGRDCGGECGACDPCAGHCSNDIHDCGETTTDCGGSCGPCGGSCDGHCTNEAFDCGETGVDCGGECPACGTVDASAVIGQALPSSLSCNQSALGTVTFENTGTTTWFRDGLEGYKLGYVGDMENPFLPAPPNNAPRVLLSEGDTVPPGESVSFNVSMRAPGAAGSYQAEFQMVLEGVHWFGAVAEASVTVTCGGGGGGCTFPQGLPEPAYHYHTGSDAAIGDALNDVMEELSGCSRNSSCPIGDRYTDQTWFSAVTAELRELGFCAGQHEEGHTDEIAVSSTGCTGQWYGYHVFNYGGQMVVWSPGADRDYYTIDAEYCP